MCRRRWLPTPGTRVRVAAIGLLLTGSYSICYLLALDRGVTPGVMATDPHPCIARAQLLRPPSDGTWCTPQPRLYLLGLAMSGLILVGYHSIGMARFSATGMLFAFAALGAMTVGAILQKGVK
jgi:hypothetical protein